MPRNNIMSVTANRVGCGTWPTRPLHRLKQKKKNNKNRSIGRPFHKIRRSRRKKRLLGWLPRRRHPARNIQGKDNARHVKDIPSTARVQPVFCLTEQNTNKKQAKLRQRRTRIEIGLRLRAYIDFRRHEPYQFGRMRTYWFNILYIYMYKIWNGKHYYDNK